MWRELLRKGLEDDDWAWDWTSLGTIQGGTRKVRAKIVSKSEGVWAADGLIDAVISLSRELEAPVSINSKVKDGQRLKTGQTLMEWNGPTRELLALERPFLNLASYAGGIATRTRGLVDIVNRACGKRPPRVTSTRKTLPAYRDIAVLSVIAGGGYSHRLSLGGGVLIKENHIAAAGDIKAAVEGVRSVAPHGLRIEVEVTSIKELEQALRSQVDGVLLDNFTPSEVRSALEKCRSVQRPPIVEVSGGLNEENIAEYALEGVDVLSVGSLTHSVKAIDLSLLVV